MPCSARESDKKIHFHTTASRLSLDEAMARLFAGKTSPMGHTGRSTKRLQRPAGAQVISGSCAMADSFGYSRFAAGGALP
jgi:hypothetical protein